MANNPPIKPLTPPKRNVFGDMLLQDLRNTTQGLRGTLGQLIVEPQTSIEEAAFVHYFLPLFAGDLKDKKEEMRKVLTAWYQVAGSPYAPVNVVKNGQVVALVPAVHQNILNGKHSGHVQDTSALMADVDHMRTLSPQAARNMEVTALHQRFLTKIPRPNLSDAQKAWFELLNRYGRAPESMSVQHASATNSQSKPASGPAVASDPDEFFDYDQ